MSILRLAPITIVLAACASEDAEPVTAAEAAVTQQAVEDTIVTVSMTNTTDLAVTAAGYRAIACAAVETDNLTFVTVTYSCTGPLATRGTVHFELVAPRSVAATVDLTIGSVSIDGAATLTIPVDATQPRTFDGELVISGPRRELTAEATASWVVTGSCVTIDAAGSASVGAAHREWTITAKTVCRR